MDKEYTSEYKGEKMTHIFCGGSNRECVKAIKDAMKREHPDFDPKQLKINGSTL